MELPLLPPPLVHGGFAITAGLEPITQPRFPNAEVAGWLAGPHS